VDDLVEVTRLIQSKHPNVPLTLVGHSMGGGVVAAALGEGRVTPERAVLLAPALWGGYVRNPSSREFVGLIRIMDRAVESASRVTTPVLVAYGLNDEVVPEEPILAAFEQFSGPKEYQKIETGWHMLLRDLEGEIVRDLVADYVLRGSTKE